MSLPPKNIVCVEAFSALRTVTAEAITDTTLFRLDIDFLFSECALEAHSSFRLGGFIVPCVPEAFSLLISPFFYAKSFMGKVNIPILEAVIVSFLDLVMSLQHS